MKDKQGIFVMIKIPWGPEKQEVDPIFSVVDRVGRKIVQSNQQMIKKLYLKGLMPGKDYDIGYRVWDTKESGQVVFHCESWPVFIYSS